LEIRIPIPLETNLLENWLIFQKDSGVRILESGFEAGALGPAVGSTPTQLPFPRPPGGGFGSIGNKSSRKLAGFPERLWRYNSEVRIKTHNFALNLGYKFWN
jgi:hypothetical protein